VRGLVVGFLAGLFLIPFAGNTGLITKIPHAYLVMLVGLPVAAVPILWQLSKFILVGILNTSIDFGILNLLIFATGYDKGLPVALLNSVSFSCAIVNSYYWNKTWVFRGSQQHRGEFPQFLVVTIISAIVSSLIVGAMTQYINPPGHLSSEQWANVAKAVSVVFAVVWNFLGFKFVVFRHE